MVSFGVALAGNCGECHRERRNVIYINSIDCGVRGNSSWKLCPWQIQSANEAILLAVEQSWHAAGPLLLFL